MAENKTQVTDENFEIFLNSLQDKEQQQDCYALAEMMKIISKCEPKMWGPSIIGFGSYHYKYASGREGDICKIGFSPRKNNISLYLAGAVADRQDLLKDLGKYKTGKGCLYIKKLTDVNTGILQKLIRVSFDVMSNEC
jgi:hypothetical protein